MRELGLPGLSPVLGLFTIVAFYPCAQGSSIHWSHNIVIFYSRLSPGVNLFFAQGRKDPGFVLQYL